MTSGDLPIIEELKENAKSATVNRTNLIGAAGKEKPKTTILQYLDGGEQPHFIFECGRLEADNMGSVDNYDTGRDTDAIFVVITDSRTFFVIRRDPRDKMISIENTEVVDVETKKGRFKHRLVVTTHTERYRCWPRKNQARHKIKHIDYLPKFYEQLTE